MDDYTQMHVFFAVTTAAVILITALTCAMIVALTRFFVTLRRIADSVHEETEEIRVDLDDLREDLKDGFRFVPFFKFFGKAGQRISQRSRTKKKARIRTRRTSGE